jgi:SAM-dependent methyltransferase
VNDPGTAPVNDPHRASAERIRAGLASGELPPAALRAALAGVPPAGRDAWIDRVFGLEAIADDDGRGLPRGCVPYLPCAVDTLLRMIDHAEIGASDVFVDIGSGVGRAAVLVHLLTGASAIGLEIQPALAAASRDLAARLGVSRFRAIEGDAARLAGRALDGTVFFLYCPFSGERLEQVLAGLAPIARARPIRVCCVDLPLPPRPWLALASSPSGDLDVYRSAPPGGPAPG